jgi:aminoglycoside phosphotransferase (APT) family kinase protein
MGAPLPAGTPDVEGIDRAGVTAWMAAEVPQAKPPLSFELIAGGRSNLTYRVTDHADQSFALRRPPVSHVLPTAHDMQREHTVLSALGGTGVPVPRMYGLCTDPAVTGAPFYVMSFVEGHILRDEDAVAGLSEASRSRTGDSLIDTLAALHDVDVEAVGLGGFARHDGYIERQLKRWHDQYRHSTVDGVRGPPVIDQVHDLLASRIPEQQGVSIVHGDYRLDNTVLDDDGAVLAILDWEICTLGDPLADLGLLLDYWAEPGDEDQALLGVAPTALPGFPRRADLLARYAGQSRRDLSQIAYYRAFGLWKLGCILQGVHARYAGGAGAGDRSGVEEFAAHVGRLGERALAEVESL